ncbi:MAG: Nif3-like dinuclear metal center hexameric protein [Bacteroidia bacterium]|nr:Nif3-like dinuclear metal center hexameric protein [Bacteroidia bacterium]
MTKIKDVTTYLESLAPRSFQESYDNSGLLTGDSNADILGVLVTLDCTEAVVDEAIGLQCNLIVAHHPILFKGLKKLTGQNYVERTIIKAIKNDIAIYAIHTNLDNVHLGVNKKIADRIGLKNLKVLSPKKNTLSKLVTFIPKKNAEVVIQSLHEAGAGNIGKYKNCSFSMAGTGAFMPMEGTSPHIGKANDFQKVEEVRVEVIFPNHLESRIMSALREAHPYEEVAHYITHLENENQEVGSGMIGVLEDAMEPMAFLSLLKKAMKTDCVRHTVPSSKTVKKIAVCGGSGSFLLPNAIGAKADVYVSADFKYHEFFDSDGKIMIADIGHYESEQFTKELLEEVIREKFNTFAIIFSKTVTNPISYI